MAGEKKSDGGKGRGEGVRRAGTGGQSRIQEQSTLRVGHGDKTNQGWQWLATGREKEECVNGGRL